MSGGEGGSSALFGNKLCYFPASNRVLGHFSANSITQAGAFLEGLLAGQYSSRFNCPEDSMAPRKIYRSDIFFRPTFERLVRRLLSIPTSAGVLRISTSVTDIKRLPDAGFRLATRCGQTIDANQVVLGTGRSSYAFLRRILTSLGIRCDSQSQDVGLRLEARCDAFTDQYRYQVDPKYKFALRPYGSARTFCGCSGGIIVPVKFADGYFADGAFGDEPTPFTNLALAL